MLHAERPDVARLTQEIVNAEKDYMALAGKEVTTSGVQDGLHQELNALAVEMGLPKLKRGFEVEINDNGGRYGDGRMGIGDRRVLSGEGRLGEATIHEMRHHEQGLTDGHRPPRVSPGLLAQRAEVELRLLDRPGGTYDFIQRLSQPDTVTRSVFYRNGSLTDELQRITEYAQRG